MATMMCLSIEFRLLMLSLVIAPLSAMGVVRFPIETQDRIVEGNKVCLQVEHSSAQNAKEAKSLTNTVGAVSCDLSVRPLVMLDGRKGLTQKIPVVDAQVLLKYNQKKKVCFDFGGSIKRGLKSGLFRSVQLLGVGELQTACASGASLATRKKDHPRSSK